MRVGRIARKTLDICNKTYCKVKKIDGPYETIMPLATYAPWKCDSEFNTVFRMVKNHTLVDKIQNFGLWNLVEESAKSDGALLEVGVWRGGTGALIAKKAEMIGIKSPVYLCDTFCGVVKASDVDNEYVGGEHSDTSIEIVENLINNVMKLKNVKILKGIFPEESFHKIEYEYFRFVHIDVDVYESANDIIAAIWDNISLGGIIAYDDYGFRDCKGITRHVNEQRQFKDRIVIHNLNGHGIIIKIR